MRRVTLSNNVELAVHERGSGVPVLLLHAWGETHRVFDRLIPLLADTMRLVAPDLRGVGESTKPGNGYTLPDMTADVIALLDALRIDACWLVGTSSGGYVAQGVALDHSDRVRGMVLIGSPSNLRRPLPAPLAELLVSLHDPVTREDMDALIRALPLHHPVPDSYIEDQVVAGLTIPTHVWRATIEGLCEAIPPVQRGSLNVPTLILWGAEEDVLPSGQAQELQTRIEGSRLVTYDGTGHMVLWEQPERVAKDVGAFITGSPDVDRRSPARTRT